MFPHATCMCIQNNNAKRNDPKNAQTNESSLPTPNLFASVISNSWTIVAHSAPIKIDVLSSENIDGLIKADKNKTTAIAKTQVIIYVC